MKTTCETTFIIEDTHRPYRDDYRLVDEPAELSDAKVEEARAWDGKNSKMASSITM